MLPEPRPIAAILADANTYGISLDIIDGLLHACGDIDALTVLTPELCMRQCDITAYLSEHRGPSDLDALMRPNPESENR